MATAPAKICIACQQDVSSKPRSKDAHGRYVCKECEAKALATGAAKRAAEVAAAAGAGADAGPPAAKAGNVSGKSSPGATPGAAAASGGYNLFADIPQPCPSCSAPMKSTASVCTICGFNKETGKTLRTQVSAEKGVTKAKGGFKFFR